MTAGVEVKGGGCIRRFASVPGVNKQQLWFSAIIKSIFDELLLEELQRGSGGVFPGSRAVFRFSSPALNLC